MAIAFIQEFTIQNRPTTWLVLNRFRAVAARHAGGRGFESRRSGFSMPLQTQGIRVVGELVHSELVAQ
jgi:hypothetical protein